MISRKMNRMQLARYRSTGNSGHQIEVRGVNLWVVRGVHAFSPLSHRYNITVTVIDDDPYFIGTLP